MAICSKIKAFEIFLDNHKDLESKVSLRMWIKEFENENIVKEIKHNNINNNINEKENENEEDEKYNKMKMREIGFLSFFCFSIYIFPIIKLNK